MVILAKNKRRLGETKGNRTHNNAILSKYPIITIEGGFLLVSSPQPNLQDRRSHNETGYRTLHYKSDSTR